MSETIPPNGDKFSEVICFRATPEMRTLIETTADRLYLTATDVIRAMIRHSVQPDAGSELIASVAKKVVQEE